MSDRLRTLWLMLKGHAAQDGIMRVDVPAVESRAELRATAIAQAVKADLVQSQASLKADFTQNLTDRLALIGIALAGKAPLVHTHVIANVAGLPTALTTLQNRVAALELKVP